MAVWNQYKSADCKPFKAKKYKSRKEIFSAHFLTYPHAHFTLYMVRGGALRHEIKGYRHYKCKFWQKVCAKPPKTRFSDELGVFLDG